MDINIVTFRLFLLLGKSTDNSSLFEQADSLLGVDLYLFDDMLHALSHIHLVPDVVVIDADIFDTNFLLEQIRKNSPSSEIYLFGGDIDFRKAIEIIRMGATDYYSKNGIPTNFLVNLQKKFNQKILVETEKESKNSSVEKFKTFGFIGNSRSMQKLYRLMENAARSTGHICISGETGSGKEFVATTIQQLSRNKETPITFFDLCAVPEELLETELFGQEKNVFSGILKRQIGIIEKASGGTLVIDNIDTLKPPLQARLQRALQEKKYLRPGGQNIVFFNARIFALSQKNLLLEVDKGYFRKDLYYLLSTILVEVPPLRKRGQDILMLASHILRDFIRKNKLKSLIFTQSAKDTLLHHPFPGNIRELKAIVESSAMMASPPEIDKNDLIFHEVPSISDWLGEELTLEQFTNNIILYYLEKYNNDVLLVAKKLDIGKSTIYRLLKKINP